MNAAVAGIARAMLLVRIGHGAEHRIDEIDVLNRRLRTVRIRL